MSFPWAVIRGFRRLLWLSTRASGISVWRFVDSFRRQGRKKKKKAEKSRENHHDSGHFWRTARSKIRPDFSIWMVLLLNLECLFFFKFLRKVPKVSNSWWFCKYHREFIPVAKFLKFWWSSVLRKVQVARRVDVEKILRVLKVVLEAESLGSTELFMGAKSISNLASLEILKSW